MCEAIKDLPRAFVLAPPPELRPPRRVYGEKAWRMRVRGSRRGKTIDSILVISPLSRARHPASQARRGYYLSTISAQGLPTPFKRDSARNLAINQSRKLLQGSGYNVKESVLQTWIGRSSSNDTHPLLSNLGWRLKS